ncbi:MAG: hemolysin family protein [Verrucomicrobiota bacterium]
MEFVVIAALIGALIFTSALISAVETAFFSLRPAQIRYLKRTRPILGGRLEDLLDNPRRLLSALLLADTCVNLPLILLCLWVMRDVSEFGIPLWASALVIFAVVVVLCDLLPKMTALRVPFRIAIFGTRVMNRLLPVLDPVCRLLQEVSERVADAVTPDSFTARHSLSEDELETLIELSAEEGALHVTESEIIQEIIKLGDKTARDCMTPRIDVFAIPDDWTNEEALPQLCRKRFPWVPVYADTPDNILGVLDVKRLLLDPGVHYTEHLTPPSYVSETMKALDLLRSFLTHPQRLAIVVDEFGGTEGIVAMPDVVEQVISDAVPSASQDLYIENFGAGRLLAAGSARLDDLGEQVGLELEAEGIDTIGGLIFNRLGYLPKPGEVVDLDGLKLTVRRASRKRIQEVLIEVKETARLDASNEQEDRVGSGLSE